MTVEMSTEIMKKQMEQFNDEKELMQKLENQSKVIAKIESKLEKVKTKWRVKSSIGLRCLSSLRGNDALPYTRERKRC